MLALKKALESHPIVYITRDIERAIGLSPSIENYYIVSNHNHFAKSIPPNPSILLIKEGEKLDTRELLEHPETIKFINRLKNPGLLVFKNTPQIEKICQIKNWKLLNPSAELANRVEEKISQGDSVVNGYWIPRKNYFLGSWLKKGGVYPEYTLRLYRNGKGRLPCKTVHEQAEVDGEVGYLKNDLLHYPYINFAGYLAKAEIYTDLTARLWRDQSVKINPITTLKYMIVMPLYTFFNIYIRHLGILDLFPGFVWALYSALHFPQAYLKYIKIR